MPSRGSALPGKARQSHRDLPGSLGQSGPVSTPRYWPQACRPWPVMICFHPPELAAVAVASLLLVTCGCATDPSRGRSSRGSDIEKAELCQEGTDGNSARTCEEARSRVLELRLANLGRLRREGHLASDLASLAELDQILRLMEGSPLPPGSIPARAVADRIAEAQESLRSDSRAMANRPLAAETYWEDRAPFLQRAPLRALKTEGVDELRRAGQGECARLKTSLRADTPYQAALVHRYCDHFGEAAEARPSRARLDIVFRAKDLSPEQQDIIRRGLVRAFEQTPWSRSLASLSLHAIVDGKLDSTESDQTVILHGSYVKHHLAPEVPWGRVVLVPQTVDYPYEARDRWRRYQANLSIEISCSDEETPLVRTFHKSESLHGRDHDVTFEPAGIHPVHTTVPTADRWLAMEFEAFATGLRDALHRHWVDTYCRAPSYSLEDAARCLLAGQTSEPVLARAAEVLGEDGKATARLAGSQAAAR
jgi:hypothetical protein